jgi:preprotein translocase subunit SecG
MNNVVTFAQIILSILLIAVILLQAKGTGLGTAFGGSGDFYATRRGMEKALFIFTIFLVIAYFLTSIVNFVMF